MVIEEEGLGGAAREWLDGLAEDCGGGLGVVLILVHCPGGSLSNEEVDRL